MRVTLDTWQVNRRAALASLDMQLLQLMGIAVNVVVEIQVKDSRWTADDCDYFQLGNLFTVSGRPTMIVRCP